MTTLWWVRHGPTHEKAFVGWRDVPADLSDTPALARLEGALPRAAVVVSSDLSRAASTADAIQRNRLRLPHEAALREFDFGDWDGLGFAEVAARDPALSRAFWETPGDVAPPNGESWDEVRNRVEACVAGLCRSQAGQNIIAVAHLGVIMTQLAHALGSAGAALAYRIEPLSLTRLHYDGHEWHLKQVNHRP